MKFSHLLLTAIMLPASLVCHSQATSAEDYFLTIGGGYSPSGNQISLEKNVQLFQRLLAEQYSNGVSHDIYFSDGEDAARDLQFHDPEFELPRANELLARVMRQTKYLNYQYRTHQIADVKGASNRKNVEAWFHDVGSKLKPGDRLFLYVTAHGGKSSNKKEPQNTVLYLWNNQRFLMKDLVALLNKVPAEVPVMTVMVQCYAGGFANLIFDSGDPKKGLSKSNRCGFFATVHNRVAAGCTADIYEENYHEYSSYFWEAIRGKTRTGTPITVPDYDNDGAVSLAEAHAYVLLTSSTIDVPVRRMWL